jgi:hypothetical protein
MDPFTYGEFSRNPARSPPHGNDYGRARVRRWQERNAGS